MVALSSNFDNLNITSNLPKSTTYDVFFTSTFLRSPLPRAVGRTHFDAVSIPLVRLASPPTTAPRDASRRSAFRDRRWRAALPPAASFLPSFLPPLPASVRLRAAAAVDDGSLVDGFQVQGKERESERKGRRSEREIESVAESVLVH